MDSVEISEERIKVAADAMHQVALRGALEELKATEIDFSDIYTVYQEIDGESDRAIAILTFSLLEGLIEKLLRTYLNNDVRGGVGKLFEPNNLLSGASKKLDLIFALHWIDKHLYDDINILKKIRNMFAHDIAIKSFDDVKISSRIQSLNHTEKPIIQADQELVKVSYSLEISDRFLYLARSLLCCHNLVITLQVLPMSQKYNCDPSMLKRMMFEDSSLGSSFREIARIFLSIVGKNCRAIV